MASYLKVRLFFGRRYQWQRPILTSSIALYRIRHTSAPASWRSMVCLPNIRLCPRSKDAIEGITHSLCTLEFEDHRPLYEWLLKKLPVPIDRNKPNLVVLNSRVL